MKVVVKYYEDDYFYDFLKQLAEINKMSFSELMRMLVRYGLEEVAMRRLIKIPEGIEIVPEG